MHCDIMSFRLPAKTTRSPAELLEQHELARNEWTMGNRLTRVTFVATVRPELAIGEECPPGMFLLQGAIQLFFQLRGVDVRPETCFACEELRIFCSDR